MLLAKLDYYYIAFTTAVSTATPAPNAASGTSSEINDLLNGTGADSGALSKPDQLVTEYGRGFVNIFRKAFIFILIIGLLGSAVGMIIHGNNQAKIAENKSGFWWKVVGGVLGFGVVSVVILLESIGKGLFS